MSAVQWVKLYIYVWTTLTFATPVIAQTCTYQTIVGLPVTFRGENQQVSPGIFHQPSAVAVGNDGTIFIADKGNHRIRAISPAGIVRTVAGTGEPAFRGDGGPARFAALKSPAGLAIADDGTLFIADSANNRIRKATRDLQGTADPPLRLP